MDGWTDGHYAGHAISSKPIQSWDNKKKYKDFVFEINSGDTRKQT